MDSCMKDLLKQLHEECVEQATEIAKLQMGFASHQRDLGKLQEDMNTIKETLEFGSPGVEGQVAIVAKRLSMGQQPPGGAGSNSNNGTWSLDFTNTNIPDGQTADVLESIQEIVAVVEASQKTLKEDLQLEVHAVRFALEGEQSQLKAHVKTTTELVNVCIKTMTELVDVCTKKSISGPHISLPQQQQIPHFLEHLGNLERNTGDVTQSSFEVAMRSASCDSMMLHMRGLLFNELHAELLDMVEGLDKRCSQLCTQKHDSKLQMLALNGERHSKMLGDFEGRVASVEARTGAVQARIAAHTQRVSAKIQMLDNKMESVLSVTKLESLQQVQQIQSLEEGVWNFAKKAASNSMKDVEDAPHSASVAPTVTKFSGLSMTAAPGQQQALSARVMAHEGPDALSENRARQAGKLAGSIQQFKMNFGATSPRLVASYSAV